ncbi:hypothetical protein AMIS_10130 [Actinoplanes missouriensis 431]|uniref:Condensation domain-containing protein n=1 Tax=Actinoplanes missouriensis (strain ATCC 14538 / DSM 43046 / CBS 188.64 / JCM 3121 / NBRC 102363 / NCIMB 12654 / NRRL B-3342 / UNCC 431) TaxID=512565 RepID=I0GZP6_ACTM4|nr:hypothetical protein [Actinoplanes missouriensis]BAL86233.1 hypothetical protein AMIS_10130 [Actinoplanes missouriensis 431]
MSTTSLTLRERASLPLEYVRTVGPLVGVTAGRIRDAMIGLHAAHPAHPIVSRLSRSANRWEHLDGPEFARFAEGAVTDLGHDPVNFEALTRQLQFEPPGQHPVRILAGGGYLAVRVSSAYAGATNPLLRELALAAYEMRAAGIPTAPARQQAALPKAWWKQVGRHPGRWMLPKQQQPQSPESGRPAAGPSTAWHPSLTMRSARSARVLDEMAAWRDRYAPGVSTAAITFAAFTAALIELGVEPDTHGGTFLLDLGPAHLPPDALTDPVAIHRTLADELASGRPLTRKMLRAGRAVLTGAPVESPPGLAFSDRGRHDLLSDLPWAVVPASRINLSVPTVSGPRTITVTSSEMTGVLHLEATFHATSYDPDVIARAVELTCTDPAGLIMANR